MGEVLEAVVVVAALGHCFVVAVVHVFPVQATLLIEGVVPEKTGKFYVFRENHDFFRDFSRLDIVKRSEVGVLCAWQ